VLVMILRGIRSVNDGLSDLVLVRLLASPAGGTALVDVRKSLAPVLATRYSRADLADAIESVHQQLCAEGFTECASCKTRLLPPGRERATAFLNAPALKGTVPWPKLRDEYLVARALGVEPTPRSRQRIGQPSGLRAEIVRQSQGLDLEPAPSINEVRERLAWKLLGEGAASDVLERARGTKFSATNALAALIYSTLGVKGRPDAAKGLAMLAAQALSSVKTDASALRAALICRLIGEQATPDAPLADTAGAPDERASLEGFAARVKTAAAACTTGRFGANRAFISHVYRRFLSDSPRDAIDEGRFKSMLVEANRAGFVRLARADIASELDPADVESSAIEYLTTTFHFIVI
jgi:hypothetical protein